MSHSNIQFSSRNLEELNNGVSVSCQKEFVHSSANELTLVHGKSINSDSVYVKDNFRPNPYHQQFLISSLQNQGSINLNKNRHRNSHSVELNSRELFDESPIEKEKINPWSPEILSSLKLSNQAVKPFSYDNSDSKSEVELPQINSVENQEPKRFSFGVHNEANWSFDKKDLAFNAVYDSQNEKSVSENPKIKPPFEDNNPFSNTQSLSSGSLVDPDSFKVQAIKNELKLPYFKQGNSATSAPETSWIVPSSDATNPFSDKQVLTGASSSPSQTSERDGLNSDGGDEIGYLINNKEHQNGQQLDLINEKRISLDSRSLPKNSKASKASFQSQHSSDAFSTCEVNSETSDLVDDTIEESEELFESTKDLIAAEANRLIHLNLENPYFLLRFFKLAQRVRSDFRRQQLLLAMETMTNSEYTQFRKEKAKGVSKNSSSSSSP